MKPLRSHRLVSTAPLWEAGDPAPSTEPQPSGPAGRPPRQFGVHRRRLRGEPYSQCPALLPRPAVPPLPRSRTAFALSGQVHRLENSPWSRQGREGSRDWAGSRGFHAWLGGTLAVPPTSPGPHPETGEGPAAVRGRLGLGPNSDLELPVSFLPSPLQVPGPSSPQQVAGPPSPLSPARPPAAGAAARPRAEAAPPGALT